MCLLNQHLSKTPCSRHCHGLWKSEGVEMLCLWETHNVARYRSGSNLQMHSSVLIDAQRPPMHAGQWQHQVNQGPARERTALSGTERKFSSWGTRPPCSGSKETVNKSKELNGSYFNKETNSGSVCSAKIDSKEWESTQWLATLKWVNSPKSETPQREWEKRRKWHCWFPWGAEMAVKGWEELSHLSNWG